MTHKPLDRRTFLGTTAGSFALASLAGTVGAQRQDTREFQVAEGDAHRGQAVISSGNGLRAVQRAFAMLTDGADPAVAVVDGVGIVEADPNDMSVGLGGLPNEEGVVELDASVMHGPTHKAGAVGALRNIVHPAQVALKVLQTTDHAFLVGEGALKFARAHGFPEQDLLTPEARKEWLRWKRNLSPNDDWLDDDQMDWDKDGTSPSALARALDPVAFTYGTIHCSAVTAGGDLGACTTTSGLSYKIPGRVGDSPIVGAGMYCDNEVGAAGATGRGEAVIESCGAFFVVQEMAKGKSPTEAAMELCRVMARRASKQRRLRNADGNPNFDVTAYALRKDGAFGSACLYESKGSFTVATAAGSKRLQSVGLLKRS
ncbi:MAG: N(4)-(beta-N-acetylglucosaminyl)-L-asparaginase [Phycisphaerales bacterium]|nr:N(4)-(beta-N-acetylglucosaminyl)-L-asparaginase [Phycisphaerales bacterium]